MNKNQNQSTEVLNRIYVEHGKGKQIAKALGCTPEFVSTALAGKKNTKLAKKVRYVAMKQYNGKEIK